MKNNSQLRYRSQVSLHHPPLPNDPTAVRSSGTGCCLVIQLLFVHCCCSHCVWVILIWVLFCGVVLNVLTSFCNHLTGKERAGCFFKIIIKQQHCILTFSSFQIQQSSHRGRESWLLYFYCALAS